MRRIEIDTGMLHNGINGISENLSEIRREIDRAYEGINRLDSMWEGEANAAFNQQFAADYNRLIEICDTLTDYNDKIEQVKAQYEDGESRVADIVAAISF